MNNITFVTVIGWETRNHHHRATAISLCKNYGLKPILKNLYIGSLYDKERNLIQGVLAKVFTTKTEKFFIGIMCQSCATWLDSSSQKKVRKFPSFEMVEFSNTPTFDSKPKKVI